MNFFHSLGAIFCFGLLGSIMVFGSFSIGLVDYDSVDNWRTALSLLHNDWSFAWNHHSPVLFLLQAAVLKASGEAPNSLIGLNIFLLLAALWILFIEIPRPWGWSWMERHLLMLAGGCSSILLYQVRGASLEPLGLFLSSLLILTSIRPIIRWKHVPWFNATWFTWGILLLVNYKAILFLPWLLYTSKSIRSYPFRWKTYFPLIANLAIPVLIINFVVALHTGSPLDELRALYGMLMLRSEKLHGALELDFYPLLFWHFEAWWWILLGILSSISVLNNPRFRFIAILAIYLTVFAMFLPKAPRGILLPTQLFFLLAYAGIFNHIHRTWLRYFILICGITAQIPLVKKMHFDYKGADIETISQVLADPNIDTVYSTVGRIIEPYLDPTTKISILLSNEALGKMRAIKGQWFLEDAMAQIAGFKSPPPRKDRPLAEIQVPLYYHPYMHLEHSEYTGRSFSEAILKAEELKSIPHLRIYKP